MREQCLHFKVVGLFKFHDCAISLCFLPMVMLLLRRSEHSQTWNEWNCLANNTKQRASTRPETTLTHRVYVHKTRLVESPLLTLAIASRTASWVNWLMKRAEDASGIWAICLWEREERGEYTYFCWVMSWSESWVYASFFSNYQEWLVRWWGSWKGEEGGMVGVGFWFSFNIHSN